MSRLRPAAPRPTVVCWLIAGAFLLIGCAPATTPAELAPDPDDARGPIHARGRSNGRGKGPGDPKPD